MELRHLRAFVTVAEERHFRRAAVRLGMTQPPLSMLIQALEQEVGTLLLRRTRRSVELTEAGVLFLAEARDVLDRAQRAIKVARDVEQGSAGRLEVGFTGSCAFNPILWRLFRAFRESYPQIDLTLTEQNTLALFERSGSASSTRRSCARPWTRSRRWWSSLCWTRHWSWLFLWTTRCVRAGATAAALRNETILLRPRPVGTGLADAIVAACRDAGFRPLVGQQSAPQMSSILKSGGGGPWRLYRARFHAEHTV